MIVKSLEQVHVMSREEVEWQIQHMDEPTAAQWRLKLAVMDLMREVNR